MLESRAERRALGASLRGARHSSSRRSLEISESKYQLPNSNYQIPNTNYLILLLILLLLNHTSEQMNDPSTIYGSDFAQKACFDLHQRDLFLRPDQNLKL